VKNFSPRQIGKDLSKAVRGDVFSDMLHRLAYATDASIYRIIPCCVVLPKDTADIAAVVKYARANKIPLAPRGAGSGVAGECLCSGIVFDTSRYMNKILETSPDASFITCQPGTVLDDLNRHLSRYNRKIGPDPSTGNRATVAGCVANNATGAHSLAFGYTADYVEKIEAVLYDGSIVEFTNNLDPSQCADERLKSISRSCLELLSDKQEIIRRALPATKRNRSGYNIADTCHGGKIDMARLLAGSEGTLAIFTGITLRSVGVAKAVGVVCLEFDSLEKMARAVPAIVRTGACACELMDKFLIDLAIDALPQYRDILPKGAASVLFVEHTGDSRQQVQEKMENTDAVTGKLAKRKNFIFDTDEQKKLSRARKDAVPLLYRTKSKKKPVPFIEDVSVSNEKLSQYISGLQQIAKKHDVAISFYGHAGDGELHVRPYLDLADTKDVEKMLSMADDVFTLAWSLGGSISGEHADGLVRAAFVKRQYGEQFYRLLERLKTIFDPEGIMNPGKIINRDPQIMTRNLRTQDKPLSERLGTQLLFNEDEFELLVSQCNGCGLCRSTEKELRMCPVFRALGDETATSRAKANIIRFWITGRLNEKDFKSPEFRKFLDLCINCKTCLMQCPSGVDISALITAIRSEYATAKGLRRAEFVLSRNRYMSILGSYFTPLSNFLLQLRPFKWLLEKITGLASEREMPLFEGKSFIKTGQKHLAKAMPIQNPIDKVAYFVDTYANYNDHALGFAVLDVLRYNQIDVILPGQRPTPLPAIVYGDFKHARRDLAYSVRHLARAVKEGYKIICSEPSAALCLQQELRHFVAGQDAELVSKNTYELTGYLLDLYNRGKIKPVEKIPNHKFLYHQPCHLYALGNDKSGLELVRKLCRTEVTDLDAGCCGLAGTFGMQKKNYQLSSKISEPMQKALADRDEEYVLTECAACGMQIEHISGKIIRHPVKIIADCYGL